MDYDMRATLEELIDGRIPDAVVPDSIIKSYLVETLAQPGGAEMMGALVSPVLGLTVGTALVEHRRHRWAGTMNVPQSLVQWLHEQGVDLHQPDAHGNTTFFQALLFDVPQGLTAMVREDVYNQKALTALFEDPAFNPLQVSPSGQSLLGCPGQTAFGPAEGMWIVEKVEQVVGAALLGLPDIQARWGAVVAMEAGGVSAVNQQWWSEVRRHHQHEFLEANLPTVSSSPRSRF